MTQILQVNAKKTWQKLNKELLKSENQSISPANIHCHIPGCVGRAESITIEELVALVRDIKKKGYGFTIYLDPKDDNSYNEFFNKIPFDEIPKEAVLNINEYRSKENGKWKIASKRYDEFCEKDDFKEGLKKAKEIDLYRSKKRVKLKNMTPEQVMEHTLNTVKDVISWMEEKTEEADLSNKKLNVLVYRYDLTQQMHHAIQHAEDIGYLKSLVVAKLGTEAVEIENVKENTQNNQPLQMNEIPNKIKAMDPSDFLVKVTKTLAECQTEDYLVRVLAGLYKILTKEPEIINEKNKNEELSDIEYRVILNRPTQKPITLKQHDEYPNKNFPSKIQGLPVNKLESSVDLNLNEAIAQVDNAMNNVNKAIVNSGVNQETNDGSFSQQQSKTHLVSSAGMWAPKDLTMLQKKSIDPLKQPAAKMPGIGVTS